MNELQFIQKKVNDDFKQHLFLQSDSIEKELDERMTSIHQYLKSEAIYQKQYDQIAYYDFCQSSIAPAEFGVNWAEDEFYPYLEKNGKETLMILEYLVLHYSQFLYQTISSDIENYSAFYINYPLSHTDPLYFDKRILWCLLDNHYILFYFMSVLEDASQNMLSGELYNKFTGVCITNYTLNYSMWNNLSDKLFMSMKQVGFDYIQYEMIGKYKENSNRVSLFTDYQPLFLRVTNNALANFPSLISYSRKILPVKSNGLPPEI